MNDFADFRVVLADPTLYRHLRGFAGVGFPEARYVAPGLFARLKYFLRR